jgi:hypothetical protein
VRRYQEQLAEAVSFFWKMRTDQARRQGQRSGVKDYGNRAAITGGGHMGGFCQLIQDLLVNSAIPLDGIYTKDKRELPGFFRPQKQWDLAVVFARQLVAAIEVKSQVGSFGNNFNNRTEEAIGNATDLWTAYREGAFAPSPRPWLGYLMLLEDSPDSRRPVGISEPHFSAFDEFRGTSYAKRYELLLLKLIRERLYDSACLLLSDKASGQQGGYSEPCEELAFERFVAGLTERARVAADLARKEMPPTQTALLLPPPPYPTTPE